MKLFIAENIKKFRKAKNITQETLADCVGVTFQSVSKWECGETYPDLELIPSLATFFGVTVDELIGSDKIRNEEKIKKYLDEYERLQCICLPESDREKNLLAEAAYKEFPCDWRIINIYRNSLSCGYTDPFQPEKLRRICEMILNNPPDFFGGLTGAVDEYRRNALESLLYIAQTENDEEEAEKLISRFPDEIYCLQGEKREDYYYRTGKTEKYIAQIQRNLETYLGGVFAKMLDITDNYYSNEPWTTPEERIAVCKKALALIDIFFEDKNYGLWLGNMALLEENLAREYFRLNDAETGFTHFEKSVDLHIKSAEKPEKFAYTSLCLNRVAYEKPAHIIADSVEMYVKRIAQNTAYDKVRKSDRFKRGLEKLKFNKTTND